MLGRLASYREGKTKIIKTQTRVRNLLQSTKPATKYNRHLEKRKVRDSGQGLGKASRSRWQLHPPAASSLEHVAFSSEANCGLNSDQE